uniref:Uncharacterized protein LOC111118207 n=1 Tax=Crassostrea virginica TaxID=6565 RepID=A0A8B8CBW5_CRAVI|nr:uncharacterized protein LOC111118207 [Crassostrea virginica]
MDGKVWVCFVLFSIAGAKKNDREVILDINKLTAYVGETGLQIRCHVEGKTVVSPTWMIMEFAGFQSKSPMLYLFRKDQKDVIEWGEEFNVTQLQDHINVTGHLEGTKSFLQLDFNKVACGDGGRYTCSYGGLDKHGRLRKFSMSGDFIAQTIDGGPPKLTIDTKVVKMYDSLKVSPGEKIHLVCEGDVGKPRIPIFWLLDEVPKPQRLLGEKDGVRQGLQIIPDDSLCSFKSESHLYFEMKKSLMVVTCKIAFRTASIFLHP